MSDNSAAAGFGKDPLTPCHGDSLVDQSFQSLKSKEIRDSMSPTHDMKFHSLSLNHPNTTGWDVQTSSEVSPDGRAYRTETVAKTDGVEKLNGGVAEFKGRNEQHSSASHKGDDKNFVKKASESSNTHLQEKVVLGDENSGRTEMKMSSTSSSSTSQVISSSSTVDYDDNDPRNNRYLMDTSHRHQEKNQQQQQQYHQEQQRLQEEQFRQQHKLQQHEHEEHMRIAEQKTQQQRQQQQHYTEEFNQSRQQSNTSRNVETEQKYEENKRYVDMDKASPEYQRHVQHLMSQPGEIISNTVEYPKPNVKMITTVKRLPDGTIVKNKRYETEELQPTTETSRSRNTTSTNQSNAQRTSERRVNDEQNFQTRQQVRDNTTKSSNIVRSSSPIRQQHIDVVDNVDSVSRHADEMTAQSFSSVKKSSRRFSTETTSETIEEFDDRTPTSAPNRSGKPQDFSTHGFPSVKPNKPTQEYPSERPHTPRKSNDFSTHGFPSVKPNMPTKQYPSDRPQTEITERHVPIVRGGEEVIIVKSETSRNMKQKTSSERIVETEVVSDDSHHSNRRIQEDYSTHGFPSVRGPSPLKEISPRQGTPTGNHPNSPRRLQPTDGYSTHGFPSVRSPTKPNQDFDVDGEVVTVSSETRRSATHKTNSERVFESEVLNEHDEYNSPGSYMKPRKPEDFSTHGFPSVKESSPSPRSSTPSKDYPSSPRRSQPGDDHSTHGFPSVRSPTKTTPDYANKPTSNKAPQSKTHTRTSSPPKKGFTTSSNNDANKKFVQKEKETDAAHRAFAASLRSSSPVDNTNRRDSNHSEHQRHTPRSSISSAKTYRRDMREGSHDSTAPSEVSRISSSTVTRSSPSKSVGKTVVTKQTVVKTRNVNGSNETIDLIPQRSPKSPSPGKTPQAITTKTTTTTTTTKTVPISPTIDVPKADNLLTKPAETLFYSNINETPLTNQNNNNNDDTNIKKTNFATNDASFSRNEVVEEPICIKKNFYKLGPSDVTASTLNDSSVLNRDEQEPIAAIEQISNNASQTTTTILNETPAQKLNKQNMHESATIQNQKPIEAATKAPESNILAHPENPVTSRQIQNQECPKLHEQPKQAKPSPAPLHTTIGKTRVVAESVAARRNIFENNGTTPSSKPQKSTTPIPTGRRPSYMDHTKSSLEHIRRDSLEINKTNYSRKSSIEEDCPIERNPNSAVKFDVPKRTPRKDSSTIFSEDIDIEEIYDLEVLEQMLETVTSYEMRRRIRAQIRLVKKNMTNSETKLSTATNASHLKSSTYTSHVHHEKTDTTSDSSKYQAKQTHDINYSHSPIASRRPVTKPQEDDIEKVGKKFEKKPRDRSHSPNAKTISSTLKEVRRVSGSQTTATDKEFTHTEEIDYCSERKKSFDTNGEDYPKQTPQGKPPMKPRDRSQSPERQQRRGSKSPTGKKSPQHHERSHSPTTKIVGQHLEEVTQTTSSMKTKQIPQQKTSQSPVGKTKPHQRDRSHSPQAKSSTLTSHRYETSSKTTNVRNTQSPERRASKPKTDEKTPIWADRRNVLKNQTTTTTTTNGTQKKAPMSPRPTIRNTATSKTMKATSSTTSTTSSQRQAKHSVEDSITSSYGIGPTDENGLPLFGIRALKKKKPTVQPCETTEVTGYVLEEKTYSDSKTKPIVERKELIYSTNADELKQLQQQVESRKSSKDDSVTTRIFKKIDKNTEPDAIMSTSDDFNASNTKYVRRGSVKEMSEKFIRKESSQSITEKSSGYPKAGLILLTSSHLNAKDTDDHEAQYEHDHEYAHEHEEAKSEAAEFSSDATHLVTESESECESVKMRHEVNQKSAHSTSASSTTRTQSTRSFLNSTGESRIVTGVDDVLERMRNADNVVEPGDTKEDREARALLNKFLGASVIMQGVESILPMGQTKTTTRTSYSNRDKDNMSGQAVKTTRITKTIKSGSSSTPVTRTTCDIEEIWDEDILKELLEQASTYEERRKIRARLRELMAEREAQQQQQQQSTSTTERSETKEKDGAVVTTTTKVTTRTVTGTAQKPVSPFAKFRQLDKQNSQPKSPTPSTPTPTTPGGSAPIFRFTDPTLNARAATVKDQLLQWCQMKTQEYENVQISNFSTSWSDGLAFCALIHHFLPDAFDYSQLTQQTRRHNFELAFTVADEKAGIAPLLDVEDMVEMKRPDWKCVFVYVQSIYRRFRNCQ